jgi:predicted small integral membrane protein
VLAARLAKLVTVSSLACLALIVTFDNVHDYDANFSFVRHVLSIDTMFQDEPLMGRAITDPAV